MSLTAMDLVAEAKKIISEIEVTEANRSLSDFLILDVREPAEYAAGALPNAVNIPRGVLEFKISNHPDFAHQQNSKILVYCLTGGRSALATANLVKLGYTQAVSMAGGITAWRDHQFPVNQA